MKKCLFLSLALLFTANAFGSTDHYIRREGDHVQHLKIRKFGDDVRVSMDVDFEPTGSAEEGRRSCSAEISGEAKVVSENEIVMRKQAEGEAHYCSLRIVLSSDGAKVEQSPDCKYFVAGICHFDSEEQELRKVK